jgi:putative PIN family toxin of toxin-antitoxin system
MGFAPELAAAYREAEYVVFGEPDLVLRIGEPSPGLDALLADLGAEGAAFLTAANPGSERRGAEENRRAAAALDAELATANYSRFPGEGRDPKGRWPAEPSVLAVGIPRAAAEALGRRFAQNAIVYIARGAAPELLFLEQLRLVLDTNVWLDWLVFDDPAVAPIRAAVAANRAEVFIDAQCEAELERALGYDLGRKFTIDASAQAACLAECRRVARRIESACPEAERAQLPACRDRDDQKFMEAALAARADFLVTKDKALLDLARCTTRFGIVPPEGLEAVCGDLSSRA